METKRKKTTVETIGQDAAESGILSGIQETEILSDEGLEIQNIVSRAQLACGHRFTGKEQNLVSCLVCDGFWCGECSKEGGLCSGCGRWLCPKHAEISTLTGIILCGDCGLYDLIKAKLKKGGLIEWLRW